MVIAHSQQKEVIYVTKTLRDELTAKPLFITAGIAERVDPGLIARIWVGWAEWRIAHGREWLYPLMIDRGQTEVWIIDDGDHATMLFPIER